MARAFVVSKRRWSSPKPPDPGLMLLQIPSGGNQCIVPTIESSIASKKRGCALSGASLALLSAEIREAYLQLELGWRQLIPKVGAEQPDFGSAAALRDESDAQPATAAVVGT